MGDERDDADPGLVPAYVRLAGLVPMGDLALAMHGLMMPVMLVPMLLRPGLYTGRMHHAWKAKR